MKQLFGRTTLGFFLYENLILSVPIIIVAILLFDEIT